MNKMDPEHKVSTSYKANLIFYNSCLERQERAKVFKDANGVWDYDLFKKIILERYERKHELDCAMVERAFKNRGQSNVSHTYVVHDPANGVEGTDLFPADCDKDNLDGQVDLSQGFNPAQTSFLSQCTLFCRSWGCSSHPNSIEYCLTMPHIKSIDCTTSIGSICTNRHVIVAINI